MGETMIEASAIQAPSRWTLNYKRLLNSLFWITSFSGSVVFIEPSPYDILILLTLVVWLLGGVKIHRAVLPGVALLGLWTLGGYVALLPYWNEPDPVAFMTRTLFVSTTGVFYMLFFSENTSERFDLCMSGYAASCMLAAVVAVGSWSGLFGSAADMTLYGRAMAPFKDPNVLGAYMAPGVLYFVQRLLLGRMKFLALTLLGLALSSAALFTSFSRGAWAAAVVSIFALATLSMLTADSRQMRMRIGLAALAVGCLAVAAALIALSNDSVREFFFQRATAVQDYDEGPTGRFGNQLRALPMLLERPNGMGPLRFRLIFTLDPHNSYINAFASNGWLGGFAFLGLTLLTTFIGLRLCLTRSPYMRQGQLVFSAMFVFFLEALQIDVDHWRYFFIYLGAVWGLEAGRAKWAGRSLAASRLQKAASPPTN